MVDFVERVAWARRGLRDGDALDDMRVRRATERTRMLTAKRDVAMEGQRRDMMKNMHRWEAAEQIYTCESERKDRMDQAIASLMTARETGNIEEVLNSYQYFRFLVTADSSNRSAATNYNIVSSRRDLLLAMSEDLCSGNASVAIEVAWILTNVSCGTHNTVSDMINAGLMSSLVWSALNSNSLEAQEQALWCLSNFAGDENVTRYMLLNDINWDPTSFLMAIVDKALTNNPEENVQGLIDITVWFAGNIMRIQYTSDLEGFENNAKMIKEKIAEMGKACLELCLRLVEMNSSRRVREVLNSISTILEHNQKLWRSEIATLISSVISCSTPMCAKLRRSVVRLIGTVGYLPSNEPMDELLNHGILDWMMLNITEFCGDNCRDLPWILSNMVAGSTEALKKVVAHPLLELVLSWSPSDLNHEGRRELYWICTNLLTQRDGTLWDGPCGKALLPWLTEMLKDSSAERECVRSGLEGFNRRLVALRREDPAKVEVLLTEFERAGGVDAVEDLQKDRCKYVRNVAEVLLRTGIGISNDDEVYNPETKA